MNFRLLIFLQIFDTPVHMLEPQHSNEEIGNVDLIIKVFSFLYPLFIINFIFIILSRHITTHGVRSEQRSR